MSVLSNFTSITNNGVSIATADGTLDDTNAAAQAAASAAGIASAGLGGFNIAADIVAVEAGAAAFTTGAAVLGRDVTAMVRDYNSTGDFSAHDVASVIADVASVVGDAAIVVGAAAEIVPGGEEVGTITEGIGVATDIIGATGTIIANNIPKPEPITNPVNNTATNIQNNDPTLDATFDGTGTATASAWGSSQSDLSATLGTLSDATADDNNLDETAFISNLTTVTNDINQVGIDLANLIASTGNTGSDITETDTDNVVTTTTGDSSTPIETATVTDTTTGADVDATSNGTDYGSAESTSQGDIFSTESTNAQTGISTLTGVDTTSFNGPSLTLTGTNLDISSVTDTGNGFDIANSATQIGLSAGAQASLTGADNTLQANAGDDLSLSGGGNTVTLTGADAAVTLNGTDDSFDAVYATGDALGGAAADGQASGIVLGADAQANITGSYDGVTLAGGATLGLYGGGNTVDAGADDAVVLGSTDDVFDLVNVTGDPLGGAAANGQSTGIYLDNNTQANVIGGNDGVTLDGGATLGLYGGGNTADAGADDAVVLGSTNDDFDTVDVNVDQLGGAAANGQGTGIYLGDDTQASLTGSNDGVTLATGDTVYLTGGGETIDGGADESISILDTDNDYDTVYASGDQFRSITADGAEIAHDSDAPTKAGRTDAPFASRYAGFPRRRRRPNSRSSSANFDVRGMRRDDIISRNAHDGRPMMRIRSLTRAANPPLWRWSRLPMHRSTRNRAACRSNRAWR